MEFLFDIGDKVYILLLQFAEKTPGEGSAYSSFIVASIQVMFSCLKKVLISLFQIPIKLASLVDKSDLHTDVYVH